MLSGEIAHKNNHYYYYYYLTLLIMLCIHNVTTFSLQKYKEFHVAMKDQLRFYIAVVTMIIASMS